MYRPVALVSQDKPWVTLSVSHLTVAQLTGAACRRSGAPLEATGAHPGARCSAAG